MLKLTNGKEIETEKGKELFLKAYLKNPVIMYACDQVGVTRRTVYHWRKNDPEFAKTFNEYQGIIVMFLEDEAYRRAVTGIEKPVFQGGQKVGTITEYSDSLLTLLLKANAPAKYKDKSSTELTGPDGKPLFDELKLIHVHSNVPLAETEDMIDITPAPKKAESLDFEELPPADQLNDV